MATYIMSGPGAMVSMKADVMKSNIVDVSGNINGLLIITSVTVPIPWNVDKALFAAQNKWGTDQL